MPYKQSES